LIFLAGAPFITETPRQGALGGLTPLENEPAARGCDVEDGDCHQCEDRDLVELIAEPGFEVPGRARVVRRGKVFVIIG
jgi:hypothetical protein